MAGYCKIGAIEGESVDASHEKWIKLISISHCMSRPVTPGATANTNKSISVEWGAIVLIKEFDISSPLLQDAIARGTVFPTVKIDLCTSVGDKHRTPYAQWELSNVLLSGYAFSGVTSDSEILTEQLSLAYEKIKLHYDKRGKDGVSDGKLDFIWNIAAPGK